MRYYLLSGRFLSAIALLVGISWVAAVAASSQDDGLIAYWNLNEGSGSVVHDQTPYGNDGTNYGAAWTAGISGSALEFVGTDIVRHIPSSFDDPAVASMSISCWVYWYGAETSCYIFDARQVASRGFILHLWADGSAVFRYNYGSGCPTISSIAKVQPNTWTHLVATVDHISSRVSLFVDGMLDSSMTGPTPYNDTHLSPAIGNNHWAPGDGEWRAFNGIIDEIRIYDRPLSHCEITSLYDYPGGTVFYPTDDAQIGMSNPDHNYGSATLMAVRNRYGHPQHPTHWECDALVRFDVSSLSAGTPVASAMLHLYYYDYEDSSPVGRDLSCFRIASDWQEETLTWNTRPGIATEPTSFDLVPPSYGWMQWDVTDDVQDFIDGVETDYGWQIMDTTYWGYFDIPVILFRSKEYADFIPFLEILTYVSGSTKTDSDTLRAYQAYSVDTLLMLVYVGDLAAGHLVTEIDPNSLSINAGIGPLATAILPSHPDFSGEVMAMTCNASEFVAGYGVVWDTTTQRYAVYGQLLDGTPLCVEDFFLMIGHRSGDADGNGIVNVSDAVYLLAYIFSGLSAPNPLLLGDADCNEVVNISDVVYLINYIFGGGPEPCRRSGH